MPDSPLRESRLTLNLDRRGILPGVCLAGHYRNIDARDMLLEHRHRRAIEICYLARGRQVYRVGGSDHALAAGDLFITFPGEQHSSGGHPVEKGELFWVQVIPQAPHLLHLPPRLARAISSELMSLKLRQFASTAPVRQRFPEFFELAARSYATPRDLLLRSRLAAVAVQLVSDILSAAAQTQPDTQPPNEINQAIAFIAAHLESAPSVRQVAAAVGLSESWFKSRFRQWVGVPPAEYILRQRLELARRQLLAGQSVTAVAMNLGFSSSQYFATVFRRYNGKRPSDLR